MIVSRWDIKLEKGSLQPQEFSSSANRLGFLS